MWNLKYRRRRYVILISQKETSSLWVHHTTNNHVYQSLNCRLYRRLWESLVFQETFNIVQKIPIFWVLIQLFKCLIEWNLVNDQKTVELLDLKFLFWKSCSFIVDSFTSLTSNSFCTIIQFKGIRSPSFYTLLYHTTNETMKLKSCNC